MERLRIAVMGPVNSGKSTLVNELCGQKVSLVSPLPGTTTDPVRKLAELPGLGPCVLIDTAGLDDASALGAERERLTRAVLDEADVVVWVKAPEVGAQPGEVSAVPPGVQTSSRKEGRNPQKGGVFDGIVPYFGTLSAPDIPVVEYSRGESVEALLERIVAAVPREEEQFLTGGLVKAGDAVVLVMPQDSEAPKGRIILPQVQVLRELLDRGCIPVCCQPSQLPGALASLQAAPALVITDSQVFKQVDQAIGKDVPLTSFSVLLASAKGDLKVFLEGARAIDSLHPGDRVLIAEACTHVPDTEDIGRVKIPALLRRKVAGRIAPISAAVQDAFQSSPLQVDIAAGNDFPEDLSQYALIIHCGACVAGKALVRSRIRKALRAGVPITNYGIAIAQLQGILERISLP
ncbi:MAG: 50S ribosome-binding GTPase [Bacteroidales bacterium]|nr:50S ribosome-binding GTPase [Bacteroidales bacterium]